MSRLRLGPATAAAVGLLLPLVAGAATIEGRVIHPSQPGAGAGREVVLLGVRGGGEPIQRTARSDASEQFRFEDLPAPGAYLIAAKYGGLSFSGRSVVFEADEAEATRTVVVHIYERSSDPSPLTIRTLEWILEREAGLFRVRKVVRVENPTLTAITVEESAPPALSLGLLAGHRDVSSPFSGHGQVLPGGGTVQGDRLELRGPFFPGERDIFVTYDVDGGNGAGLRGELVVHDPIEVLDVRVRDFGVVVDAGPLHPARPTRDKDEVYLRYLGFDLAPGRRIPLELTPLPPRRQAPLAAQSLVVAALGGGLLFLVLRPLREATAPAPSEEERTVDLSEREALFEALRDLEHDFETGKLSSIDRDRLREELRQDALRALSTREASRPAPETPAPPPEACECGHRPLPGDRFCARCGRPL